MDKDGAGDVSLVEFKAALMERRLAIVEKDQERREQQQQQQEQDPKPPAAPTDVGVGAAAAGSATSTIPTAQPAVSVEDHPPAGKGKEGDVEEVTGGIEIEKEKGEQKEAAAVENDEGEKTAGSIGAEIDIEVQ